MARYSQTIVCSMRYIIIHLIQIKNATNVIKLMSLMYQIYNSCPSTDPGRTPYFDSIR